MSRSSSRESDFRARERAHESFLQKHIELAQLKLRWRSSCLKHFLHVIPGETILQLGAGSGLWTQRLAETLLFENDITAAVFSPELLEATPDLPKVRFFHMENLDAEFLAEKFDYVVSSNFSLAAGSREQLALIHRFLKPGGQIFFFDSKAERGEKGAGSLLPGKGSSSSVRAGVARLLSEAGFCDMEIAPYDILPWNISPQIARRLQAKTLLLEHAPIAQNFADSIYIAARKGGIRKQRSAVSLTGHGVLNGKVSVVVPCHNEAANIADLTDLLLAYYNSYIHEILIVNDNSSDNTIEVVSDLSLRDPRIKLLNRSKPNGVGRALRDGYRAASGQYILSMDCDFVSILPELRGLFDVIAQGHDGAIGSRFSHESVILNYPFSKMACNRLFHLLIKLVIRPGVRDVTNNLKLYRSQIFKSLEINSPHFSANLETGLKPLLQGYDIKEVPISWINRTAEMGTSNFKLGVVGGDYIRALVDIWITNRFRKRERKPLPWSARQLPETAEISDDELEKAYQGVKRRS